MFYKDFRMLLDRAGLNILPLLRGRSEVQILSGTPMKKTDQIWGLGMIKQIKSFLFVFLFFLPWMIFSTSHTKFIDLTYPFDQQTIYWPTEKGFALKKIFYGKTPAGYFYSAYKFCAPEHGGTHVDAPRHFAKQGLTVDKIPIDSLHGDALVINVEPQVSKKRQRRPSSCLCSI